MNNIFQIVRSIKKDNFEAYEKEMNNAYLNANDENKFNLLQAAISYKQERIALDLVSIGIDVNHQNNKGQTALHLAAVHNSVSVAKSILSKGGDVNIIDSFGNNALWTAVMNAKGNYTLVKLYMENNGNLNNVNNHNKSPLDFAKQINDLELVAILIS